MSIKAIAKPARTLLSPTDHAVMLIDHQSQMAFNTKSTDTTTSAHEHCGCRSCGEGLQRSDDHFDDHERYLRGSAVR